ncbi:MAG: MFS transporter [Lentisphaerae bacterium]|nr:MFS transporter [Lentisphaerota bacterium]
MKIFLCPALVDLLLFLIAFAVMYRSGEWGLSVTQCAWLAGLFQLTYMPASVVIGLLLSRRNARAVLLVAVLLCTIAGMATLLAGEFIPLLVAYGSLGIFSAIFFNAFQSFMRAEAAPGDLRRTVGRYTLAWSLGSAVGILLSGFFYRCGFLTLAVLTLLGGLAILGVLLRHKARPLDALSADEQGERALAQAPPVNPRYVWIGWLLMLAAIFLQRPIQTFFPVISAKTGISAFMASLPLFLQMAVQALISLAMIRGRHWLYRRAPLAWAHGLAVLLALAMWWRPTFLVCFLGISLSGIYMGFVCYCSVYYSSNSGRRAFNIGVNEFLGGLGSLASLLASQWLMKRTSDAASMYLVIALALLILLVIQLVVAGRARPEVVARYTARHKSAPG